jgi:hypothetical protein
MSCKVRARRGILVYRVRFSGHETQEGTTSPTRRRTASGSSARRR